MLHLPGERDIKKEHQQASATSASLSEMSEAIDAGVRAPRQRPQWLISILAQTSKVINSKGSHGDYVNFQFRENFLSVLHPLELFYSPCDACLHSCC